MTYTFHLRKGIKFTDGTPFDAEAVKVNFDRYLNKESPVYDTPTASAMANLAAKIDSYRVVDRYTFEIKLEEATGAFLSTFARAEFGIMSPTALQEWSHDMTGEHLVGTGPFKFVEHERGARVVLEKNPDYWNKEGGPYLDKVIFIIMPDDSARLGALKIGEIDVSIVVPMDRVKDLQEDPNVEVVFPSQPHTFFWQVNMDKPELQDLRVRQALWHAIDTGGMVKSIFGDVGVPLQTFLPPGNPAYRPNYKRPYPYDPEKVKELLAEAGYAPGELKIVLAYPIKASSYSEPSKVAEWTQANLKAAGFDAELDLYEFGAFLDTFFFAGGMFHADLIQHGNQSLAYHPYLLDQVFGPDSRGSVYNPGHWQNPEFDKWLDQARPLPLEESIPIYQKAEDILLQDVGTIPIVHDKQPRAYHKRVKDLLFGPSTWWELTNVWVEPQE